MSMKRSREVSRGRAAARDLEAGFWEKKGPEKLYTFEEDVAPKPDDAFVPYTPTRLYEKDALVTHPKFGKGIVTSTEPGKVDVLFEGGARKLSHGLAAPPAPRKPVDDPPISEEPPTARPGDVAPVAAAPATSPSDGAEGAEPAPSVEPAPSTDPSTDRDPT